MLVGKATGEQLGEYWGLVQFLDPQHSTGGSLQGALTAVLVLLHAYAAPAAAVLGGAW